MGPEIEEEGGVGHGLRASLIDVKATATQHNIGAISHPDTVPAKFGR